jgi:hypothetical protein
MEKGLLDNLFWIQRKELEIQESYFGATTKF